MGILLSSKLGKVGPKDYIRQPSLAHWCEGCEEIHHFSCEVPQSNGAIWTWDKNVESPTFNPSMHIRILHTEQPHEVCHYFLRSGQIEYLSDSTHRLSGQTVPLIDIPDNIKMRWRMNEMRGDDADTKG